MHTVLLNTIGIKYLDAQTYISEIIFVPMSSSTEFELGYMLFMGFLQRFSRRDGNFFRKTTEPPGQYITFQIFFINGGGKG